MNPVNGEGGDKFPRKIVADFSENTLYSGLTAGLKSHLAGSLDTIVRYPSPDAGLLQEALEKQLEQQPGTVLVTNGATQAVYLIAQLFAGATTSIIAPTFSAYEAAARLFKHQVSFLWWDKLDDGFRIDTDLVFICNPNNPGGQVLEEAVLQRMINANRKTIFVVDEAYIDFTRETRTLVTHIHRLPNLLVLRSPAKVACFPGLRLGYIAGQKPLLDRLRAFQPPWSVNQLAITAGMYMLAHPREFAFKLDDLLANTFQLREKIKAMPEFKVYSSYTHYFLFETLTGTATELRSWLLDKYAILIRDASDFEGLSSGFCRIACRSEEDNKLLITALKKWSHL
ncbi:histidinol-phosphate transaminase [Chitinophaga sp. Cy-1792]|uniref:pyridoxal phosphate-dependent aminotransferase n=1 Tax=Chitinophaga sp. Cy-1792 TaxID=2608339 RepID=UPI00142345BE|nr:aminotransferase class I/II-fold pyridoxal phosphate-dependent enzyme [Chitinophaga sp. Cy-1792]NIG54580.1 aminotransferase class I/II-fold pyridoxal phosphate-dependent enzyme [Chitinophaga sp. Cy-1792]